MRSQPAKTALEQGLFSDPDFNAYAIVDGAQVPNLPNRLINAGIRYECLFVGDLAPELRAAAPHLVQLDAEETFFDVLFNEGWGQGWAIYLRSTEGVLDLRKHLRKLTTAQMPDNEIVYFRYYDPKALCMIMPTLTGEQRMTFFGDTIVDRFYCEDDDGELVSFNATEARG